MNLCSPSTCTRQLEHRADVHPDFATVDGAEQARAITGYPEALIDRSLRSARTVEDRAAMTQRIVAVLPEAVTDGAALHRIDPRARSRASTRSAGPPRWATNAWYAALPRSLMPDS